MIIFKDKSTGAELFTDSYKYKLVGNNIAYEVDGKLVTQKEGDVDIGANASAEEPGEQLEQASVTGVDFVISNQLKLTETKLKKKQYLEYLKKDYMRVLDYTKEEKEKIWEDMVKFVKEVIFPDYKNFDHYVGKDLYYVPEDVTVPLICLLNYRENGDPYMVVFKHGLEEEKA